MKLLIAATHVVLLLSYVVSTVSAQERKPVLEQFEEYMEGGPGPTSSTDQAQVNPPKVWRRKREVKESKLDTKPK